MNKEDKELLLKDLCARLPYETWVQYEGKEWLVTGYGHGRVSLLPSVFSSVSACPLVEEIRPYFRPMSSMTEEEIEELLNIDKKRGICSSRHLTWHIDGEVIDYLNRKMFDYRGLIEKGLALEAPKDMY